MSFYDFIGAERVPALCTHNLLLAALRYPADIYQDEDTRETVNGCKCLRVDVCLGLPQKLSISLRKS